ncbi:MAG: 50S ribosomal protein L11 methyltransferase, partial [Vulcanococcus sp.]
MALAWWRLELLALPELEESLTWKLNALGIPRVALRHSPDQPQDRKLVAWLPASDWPESERQQLEQALQPLAETFGLTLPTIHWFEQD